jgi:hypothetical protein
MERATAFFSSDTFEKPKDLARASFFITSSMYHGAFLKLA